MAEAQQTVTAAILVIGDEILSGRTKDRNIGHIAETLADNGIDVREVRVVPDVEDEIVAALDALRSRYDHVFTTGGIGPTHDDITADAVARAFGVGIDHDPRAVDILTRHYGAENLNEGRLRMARIPDGADLVANPVSAAPGFRIGNVVVMAGVPNVMHRMLDSVLPTLATGRRTMSRIVRPGRGVGESMLAAPLKLIAEAHPEVSIGSYPSFDREGFQTELIVRGKDEAQVEAVAADVEAMVVGVRAAAGLG